MRNKKMMAGLAAAAGAGFIAGKKRYENKNSYHKLLNRIEDYIGDIRS